MKRILTFFIIATALNAQGQTFFTNLYGFRLGQYREAAKNQLGKPFKSGKEDDGFEYEAFLLSDNTSYVAFEYSANDPKHIWSIQFTGASSKIDPDFRNLRLGMAPTEVETLLGKLLSITVKDIGEYGNLLTYDKTNLTVEINKSNKLSSIKILNNSNDLFPKGPDVKKIPTFEVIQKTLNSGSNADILKLLAGDVKVYYKGETYYFKKSFLTEQTTDYSKVLSIIKTVSKDLVTVNVKSPSEYEENMRISLGEDIKHVIKIKKGHQIKEITLKYFAGRYYISEINADNK